MLGKGAFITTHMAITKISLGLWKNLVYKIKERFYGWRKCQNLVQSKEFEGVVWRKKLLCTIEVASVMNWTYGGSILVTFGVPKSAQSAPDSPDSQIAQIAESAQKGPECLKAINSAQ